MKKYISILALALTVGIAGCKKDYLSLENNPNQPSVTTPQLALPAAEVAAAAIVADDYPEYGVWGGYWTTSGNYVPNQQINEYQLTTGSYQSWDALYLNLSNITTLQNLSAANGSLANFQAIAMILRAYDFEEVVDNYNDAPYTQAFNPSILTPKYDKGVDIYHDLGKQLDAAIALIGKSSSATNPGSSDVIFNGNMTMWAKFANTIKLRLAVRVYLKLGKSDPLVADLGSTASTGYLGTNTADTYQSAYVNPGYTSSNSGAGASQESPFYGDYGYDITGNPTGNYQYYRANAFAVSFYKTNNDPRLSKFYSPVSAPIDKTDTIRGNIFGDIANNLSNPNTSAIGTGLLQGPTQNSYLLTGSESLFLQAEAIQNGLIQPQGADNGSSAVNAYQAGITESFQLLGLTVAQAQTYYGQASISGAYAANPEQAIITQKWAALNGWFNLESYNEYRRTGIPALQSSIDPAAISKTLPTRILYPTSELSSNTANLAAEGAISQFTSKIFWAQ